MKRLTLLVWVCLSSSAFAGDEIEKKPFAEAHVLLQVSQASSVRHGLTLDIASNLGKHYGGQDLVDIQVVAFGPGVGMLFVDSPHASRVLGLLDHGVRFFVCGNTLDTIERRDGRRPQVLPGVVTVQTGVAFMVEQIASGYTHIQP